MVSPTCRTVGVGPESFVLRTTGGVGPGVRGGYWGRSNVLTFPSTNESVVYDAWYCPDQDSSRDDGPLLFTVVSGESFIDETGSVTRFMRCSSLSRVEGSRNSVYNENGGELSTLFLPRSFLHRTGSRASVTHSPLRLKCGSDTQSSSRELVVFCFCVIVSLSSE